MVREVNVRVVGKGLELLSANGGCFEINQLCRLVSEIDRVGERRKLRVNVGKSKAMRCSR